jgi:ribosome-associated protein
MLIGVDPADTSAGRRRPVNREPPTAEGRRPCRLDEEYDLNVHETTEHDLVRWVRMAVDAADDKLGRDTQAFFVGEVLGITDWFVITSGRTARQVRAIVDEIEELLTVADGPKPLRIEGKDTLDWVLMDYGSFIIHVLTTETREYYELERLWKDVPRLVDVA